MIRYFKTYWMGDSWIVFLKAAQAFALADGGGAGDIRNSDGFVEMAVDVGQHLFDALFVQAGNCLSGRARL